MNNNALATVARHDARLRTFFRDSFGALVPITLLTACVAAATGQYKRSQRGDRKEFIRGVSPFLHSTAEKRRHTCTDHDGKPRRDQHRACRNQRDSPNRRCPGYRPREAFRYRDSRSLFAIPPPCLSPFFPTSFFFSLKATGDEQGICAPEKSPTHGSRKWPLRLPQRYEVQGRRRPRQVRHLCDQTSRREERTSGAQRSARYLAARDRWQSLRDSRVDRRSWGAVSCRKSHGKAGHVPFPVHQLIRSPERQHERRLDVRCRSFTAMHLSRGSCRRHLHGSQRPVPFDQGPLAGLCTTSNMRARPSRRSAIGHAPLHRTG